MARRSAASESIVRIVPSGPRFEPPKILKQAERQLFLEVIANNPHITITDIPMLVLYCQKVLKVQKAGTVAEVRLVVTLARSLRLTAQSASKPETVARKRRNHQGTVASSLREFRVEDEED